MKKLIITLFLFIMIISLMVSAYADLSSTELNFKIVSNEKEEEFDTYILLPKSYIQFAITNSLLTIKYEGPSTLKNNYIPGINIENTDNIQDEIYKENDTEYVQILLEPNEEGILQFDILEDYNKLDIKYRIKNDEKDFIVHIDNFKIENGKCEIEYNYDKNTVKQPDKEFTSNAKILIFIVILVIIIWIISYIKRRR